MPMVEQLILRFSGDKAELKKQLQEYCEKSKNTMNGTVIELIEQLLETKEINKLK
jgi:hypothetical protein